MKVIAAGLLPGPTATVPREAELVINLELEAAGD